MPLLTILRAIQGLCILGLCAHYFETLSSSVNDNALIIAQRFLFHVANITVIIYIIALLFSGYEVENLWFGFLKSNALGGAASVYCVSSFVAFLSGLRSQGLFGLMYSTVLLYASGTITAVFAGGIGLIWVIGYTSGLSILCWCTYLSVAGSYIFIVQPEIFAELIGPVAWAFDRETDSIIAMTGRMGIWQSVIEMMDSYPSWGAGFAMDQSVLLPLTWLGERGIVASAHNLFLESYIAARWVTVTMILCIFIDWWWYGFSLSRWPRAMVYGLLIIALISANQISGIGGSAVNSTYTLALLVVTISRRRPSLLSIPPQTTGQTSNAHGVLGSGKAIMA